jgi:hypothetical protein
MNDELKTPGRARCPLLCAISGHGAVDAVRRIRVRSHVSVIHHSSFIIHHSSFCIHRLESRVDTITQFLFESPMQLASVCGIVCLVLLVMWRRTGSAGRRKAFLAAAALSCLLLALQAVVVTDRERIVWLMDDLAKAVEAADIDRIEQSIDADYKDDSYDRTTFLAHVRNELTHYSVRGARLSAFKVSVSGNEATVSFRVVCEIRDRDGMFVSVLSRWQVDLVRRDTGWMVRSTRRLELGPR